MLHPLLDEVPGLTVAAGGADIAQMTHEGAYIPGDGHLVVIQDDDHGQLLAADVVQGLEGHAPGQGSIADDSHYPLRRTREHLRLRETRCHREGIRGMAGGMRIEGAL